MEIKIFDHDSYSPLKPFGFTHEFFKINYHTIISTWVVLALLIIIAISLKIFNKKTVLYNYLIKKYVLSFENIVTQDDGALKILQQKGGIITKNNWGKAWKCELFFVSL